VQQLQLQIVVPTDEMNDSSSAFRCHKSIKAL